MPDMFFFRDPEEIEAEAAEKANKLAEEQAAAGLGEPRAVDWEVTGPGAGIANAAATMVGDVDWAAPEATTDWGRCPPSYVHLAPQQLTHPFHASLPNLSRCRRHRCRPVVCCPC